MVCGPSWAHHNGTFDNLNKVPPQVPAEAQQSGYCCMIYDINSDGGVKNAKVDYCTETYLAQPSVDALTKWKYKKLRKDGTPVAAKNLTTHMAFHIAYWDGTIVPGKFGYMSRLSDGTYNQDRPCGLKIS